MNRKYMVFLYLITLAFHSLSAFENLDDEKLFLNVVNDFEKLKNLPEKGAKFVISANLKTEKNGIVMEEGGSINYISGSSRATIYEDGKGKINVYFSRENKAWVYREGLRLPIQVSYSITVAGEADLWQILGQSLIGDYKLLGGYRDGNLLVGELEARSMENVPYPFVDVFADPENNVILKLVFKSINKKSLKETIFSDYRILPGEHRFPVYLIRNLVMNKELVTEIRYSSVERHNLPSSFFQPNVRSLDQFIRIVK